MKKISILIPTYNEEGNVVPLSEAVVKLFDNELKNYDYEIIFIDNYSKDNTRTLLSQLCKKIIELKLFLMPKILDNLIHHIMDYVKQQVIVQYFYVQIFKTL